MCRVSLKGDSINPESTKSERLILWTRALALHAVLWGAALLPYEAMAQSSSNVEPRTPASAVPANHAVTRAPLGVLKEQPASTRRMIDRIQEIYRSGDMRKDPYRSDDRSRMFKTLIDAGAPPDKLFDLKSQYSSELLKSGRNEEALQSLEEMERMIEEKSLTPQPYRLPYVLNMQAVCHLRIGEQENCLLNHNAESCIFPFRVAVCIRFNAVRAGRLRC